MPIYGVSEKVKGLFKKSTFIETNITFQRNPPPDFNALVPTFHKFF
jgi:hypothetical protein